MHTYTTRTDAISREIVEAIEAGGVASADDYNIDAIANVVLGDHEDGYAMIVSEDEFWAEVSANEFR